MFSLWGLNSDHFVQCVQGCNSLKAETKEARKAIEQSFGAWYSVLYEIEYYDSIRFSIIDIMHNLFLALQKQSCLTFMKYSTLEYSRCA